MVEISIRRLDPELPLPSYAHPGDAGADLCSAVDVTLQPGERALVPTGIAMALPEGYVALVHPRSGLAARHGISIVNAPGTIDAGYRGEVQVCLVNTDPHEPFAVKHVHLIRFADDARALEHWAVRDDLGLAMQAGLLPAPPGTADGDGA